MKRLFIFFVCGITILAIVVGVVSWLSWQPQSWYSPPDYSQPEVATRADRAEFRLNEEFHKVRPEDEVWKLRIGDEAMNAWLVGRLKGWLTHDQQMEWPSEIHDLQVHVTPSGIWIAARIEIEESNPRPLAMQIGIWVSEGTLVVEPISIRLGRIPVPLSLFESAVETLRVESKEIEAIVPLMDDREVEVIQIELEEGSLVLTCQTYLPK